jgi:O-antigen ligase
VLSLRLPKNPLPALVAATLALLTLLVAVPNPMTERLLASGLRGDVTDAGVAASNRQRRGALRGGLRMVADNPLTGVGLGNFKNALPDYVDLEGSSLAHNTYLEVAAELGIPALIAFSIVIVAALRSLERSARVARLMGDQYLHDLALGLQAGLAGYLVGATFLSAQHEKFFWLVMFLSITVEQTVRRKARALRRQMMAKVA